MNSGAEYSTGRSNGSPKAFECETARLAASPFFSPARRHTRRSTIYV